MFSRFSKRNPGKSLESYLRDLMFTKTDNQELAIPITNDTSYGFSRAPNFSNSAFVEIKQARKHTSETTTSSKQHENYDNQTETISPKIYSSTRKNIKKPVKKRFLHIGERDKVKKRLRRPPNHLDLSQTYPTSSKEQTTTSTYNFKNTENTNFATNADTNDNEDNDDKDNEDSGNGNSSQYFRNILPENPMYLIRPFSLNSSTANVELSQANGTEGSLSEVKGNV